MISLHLIAEFADATTREEAMAQLDAFREAVLPAENYGVLLYLCPENTRPPEPEPGDRQLV